MEFIAMSESKIKYITYTGPSMNPTLQAPDMLKVKPYNDSRIQGGDVIAFVPPGGKKTVIHRVISIDSQGIRTLGDHNAHVDEWTLRPDDIIGRVVMAQRGERWLQIYGGTAGRIYALVIRMRRMLKHIIYTPFHAPYRRIAKSGIFRVLLPGRMKIRVLSFNRPHGTDMQLLMGRRVIGRYLTDKNRWKIQRPFRLLVDEASLPRGTTEH